MEIKYDLSAPYYTRSNLETILGSKRRTLDYKISRLISKGILERIKPGFYLNKKLLSQSSRKEELLEYVGNVVKYPSYVSCEYALSKYGFMSEGVFAMTLVTAKKTGVYFSDTVSFRYKNIKPELFTDYEKRGFNGIKYLFATKYKALFDFIYLTPISTQSKLKQFLLDSRLNYQSLTPQDKKCFIDICQRSRSQKMKKVVRILRKEKFL